MRKSRQLEYDWRKPRFHRSDLKVIRGKMAKGICNNKAGKIISADKCVRWKSPISRETFDSLVERGLLSGEQIEQYLRRTKGKTKKRKSIMSNIGSYKDFILMVEISKLNLKTTEGLGALSKLVKEQPEALHLIEKAQELKAIK